MRSLSLELERAIQENSPANRLYDIRNPKEREVSGCAL